MAKTSSSWILQGLNKVDRDTRIEDIVEFISGYHTISPKTYFSDIINEFQNHEYWENISTALMAFYNHLNYRKPLKKTIEESIVNKQSLPKRKTRNISFDCGLKQLLNSPENYSPLVKDVIKIIKQIGYIIPRTYSDSDFFDPRLFIIGYRYFEDEKSEIQGIIRIIGSEKTIKDREGKDIDLIKKGKTEKESYRETAKKRLNQIIIPNISSIYRECPDHNIIAVLGADLSLEHDLLYKTIEEKQIPYMAVFPRTGILWNNLWKGIHLQQLKNIAGIKNE